MNGSSARALLLAVTGAGYESELLALLDRLAGRLHVARRCLDVADLLAAAASGLAGVALVDAGQRRFDADAVARLGACGVAIVGVVPAAPGSVGSAVADTTEVLARHGVRWVVPSDISGDDLVRVLELAGSAAPAPGSRQGFSVPWLLAPGVVDETSPPPAVPRDPGARDGLLVAVWGPAGAPGRTSVALSLADELAEAGFDTLLADADTYAPCLAQRLALLDEASGLASAARAARVGELSATVLASHARALRPRLRLLTGLSRPERWPELSAAALERVWLAARAVADWTVVDCGFCLEHDEELAYDTMAPRRNAATTTSLAAADIVLLVARADPVGVARLVRSQAEVRALAPHAWLRVVLTQVRAGPVGRHPERQLTDLLARHGAPPAPVLVPDDRAAHDAALLRGRSLREVAPRSSARIALASLATELAAESARSPRSAQRVLGR